VLPEIPVFVLAPVPPWLVLSGLLGVINAAACFMLVGSQLPKLGWYVVLGVFAAGLGQAVGSALGAPTPLKIGDVNVLSASVGVWLVIVSARLGGL
jgi:hypothetical protein